MTSKNPDDEFDFEDVGYLHRSVQAAAQRRGAASHRHAPSSYQTVQEIDVCEDLARSLSDQDKGEIRDICKNVTTDFPDCLATLDGNPIGIEVVELMDQDQAYAAWSKVRFARELAKVIGTKDDKAQEDGQSRFPGVLSRLLLVIHTDEADLTPLALRQYMEHLEFPKPNSIDKAYVLGPYEPAEKVQVRGRQHEPREVSPQYTAFPVRWHPNPHQQ